MWVRTDCRSAKRGLRVGFRTRVAGPTKGGYECNLGRVAGPAKGVYECVLGLVTMTGGRKRVIEGRQRGRAEVCAAHEAPISGTKTQKALVIRLRVLHKSGQKYLMFLQDLTLLTGGKKPGTRSARKERN